MILSLNHQFFYWSIESHLNVRCQSDTFGTLGNLQGTSTGRPRDVVCWLGRTTENKHDVYRRKAVMEKSFEFLREHAMKIVIFKKKKMQLLTKEQQKSYGNAKICYIYKEKFENKYLKDTKYRKDRDNCHYTGEYKGAGQSICYSKDSVPKKIPIVFHNGSNYDYHFIMKELAEEFKKQFTCLGENTEKYITFTVPIEKEVTRIDKNGKKITKNISFILQFINSARFMASSLSNLVNNLSEM